MRGNPGRRKAGKLPASPITLEINRGILSLKRNYEKRTRKFSIERLHADSVYAHDDLALDVRQINADEIKIHLKTVLLMPSKKTAFL
jgi:hypothetical protein